MGENLKKYVRLEKQLIMKIGLIINGLNLTEEMLLNSLESFTNVPITYNKNQGFTDCDSYSVPTKSDKVIGIIPVDPNIIIEEGNIYADIIILEEFSNLWLGSFDNWCISLSDDKKSFFLCSIEVF